MAGLIEGWVKQLRADRRFDVIDAVLDRRLTLPDAYDHARRGDLDAWLAEQREADLDPLVDQWNGRGQRAQSPKYVRQVREFIPAGERFPASRFRRREIARFLEELEVSDPTRNRYKAALSQFGAWLVRHEVLDTNPVRDAGTFSERAPRLVHLEPSDARRLVDALEGDARICAAIMAGTGMEWGAVAALHRSDVDVAAQTMKAHGSKTKWRKRTVRVTEDWCWSIIADHCKLLLPNARLITGRERQILEAHRDACERLEIVTEQPIRLHDWRHTYAVTAIRRRDDHQAIKRQLGHAPQSALLYTVYGVYIAEVANNSATTAKKRREVRRAN
jgi:integrase